MAKHIGHTLPERARTQVQQLCPIMVKGEMDVRIDQDNTLEGRKDIVKFRSVGFQELTACWNIIEKVFHAEVTAHRARYRLLRDHPGSSQTKAGAHFVGFGTSKALSFLAG